MSLGLLDHKEAGMRATGERAREGKKNENKAPLIQASVDKDCDKQM